MRSPGLFLCRNRDCGNAFSVSRAVVRKGLLLLISAGLHMYILSLSKQSLLDWRNSLCFDQGPGKGYLEKAFAYVRRSHCWDFLNSLLRITSCPGVICI